MPEEEAEEDGLTPARGGGHGGGGRRGGGVEGWGGVAGGAGRPGEPNSGRKRRLNSDLPHLRPKLRPKDSRVVRVIFF
jgi:hypothetical protein